MSIDDPTVVEQVADVLRNEFRVQVPWLPDAQRAFIAFCAYTTLSDAGLLRPEPVWLDPQPVVPRPEPDVPTLAKDVGGIEILVEGEPAALVALGRAIAAALAGEVK